MSAIITALDFSVPSEAMALARRLDPAVTRVKVGKELFTRAGPSLVSDLQKLGFDVFLDLKFHDIPNTVAGALRAAEALGVWMVNIHASGGARMLEAARNAITPIEAGGGTHLIAVTVLTSLEDADLADVGIGGTVDEQVHRLTALSAAAGVDGVVCSPRDIIAVRRAADRALLTVTPGIRPKTSLRSPAGTDDQRRSLSPREAVRAGVDYMVIGRPITAAPDPLVALERIAQDLASVVITPQQPDCPSDSGTNPMSL